MPCADRAPPIKVKTIGMEYCCADFRLPDHPRPFDVTNKSFISLLAKCLIIDIDYFWLTLPNFCIILL